MDRIRVDQVVTDRDLDAAEPFPADIDPALLQQPILVSADNVLIDGLRRLGHAKREGAKTIKAVSVSTVDEAIAVLGPQHEGRKLTPRQHWNILRIIYPWGIREGRANRIDRIRVTFKTGETAAEAGAAKTPLRLKLAKALNAGSGHGLERTLYLYRAAESGNKQAQELTEQVDAGEQGIFGACKAFDGNRTHHGTVREINEQKTLLENGSRNLGAQVDSLWKLGLPALVTDEVLERTITALVSHRSRLSAFISILRSAQRERTNG